MLLIEKNKVQVIEFSLVTSLHTHSLNLIPSRVEGDHLPPNQSVFSSFLLYNLRAYIRASEGAVECAIDKTYRL
jgi:hypothetical protein